MSDNQSLNNYISAWTLSSPQLLTQTAIPANSLALELERVLAFTYIYACLNASWWLSSSQLRDREEAQEIICWHLSVAQIIEPHVKML